MSCREDEKVLEEMKAQNLEGFTDRGKVAIMELADKEHGAMIFLIVSLNSRIRDLEMALSGHESKESRH